jgi:hypothetical protein
MALFLGLFDYIFQITASGIVLGDPLLLGIGLVLFVAVAAAYYFNGTQE